MYNTASLLFAYKQRKSDEASVLKVDASAHWFWSDFLQIGQPCFIQSLFCVDDPDGFLDILPGQIFSAER